MVKDVFMADAESFFKKPCRFVLGVAQMEQLPPADLPEIAFAGRSNVGKSSLINALLNAPMARTSATPGRTQQMNFFLLDESLYLVDLPGYGYAKAPEKEVKKWNESLMAYLQGRPNLHRVFLLIDSRHGIGKKDEEMMERLEKAAVSFQIVLTKADKPKAKELERITVQTEEKMKKYTTCYPILLLTSSEKKQGLTEVKEAVFEITSF